MPSRSASPEPGAKEGTADETILVGVLSRPHGIRGELRLEIHSDNPARFAPGSELLLVPSRGPRRPVRVRRFRPVPSGGLIAIEGCETREEAEELQGARLEVERSRVPVAPAGFYYQYELVGCRCFEAAHGELGEVVDLVEDGGGHLLRVQSGGRELLVPFVEAFLERVDVAARRIDLKLPPGLVEICASES
jgi:16S rRNA processing protein RimM